ncbi:hypothetical protein B9T62_30155 [Paenibacillus donghaensis]|uniref:Uncharacterized protein n=1 Tax=Paenibacillus donghaensis TaxID=414771 RepID=A0A2Z2KTJ0_9BACL|nr:hypothetical protein B9T62_30155 [Paenibacillus donghaensis]
MAHVDPDVSSASFGAGGGGRPGGFSPGNRTVPGTPGAAGEEGAAGGSAAPGSDASGAAPEAGSGTGGGEDAAQGDAGRGTPGSGFTRPGGGGGFGFAVSGQYGTLLGWYAALFAGLFAAAFYCMRRGKLRLQESRPGVILGLLLAAGLCLKIAAAPWIDGYVTDINFFKTWATQAAESLGSFYLNSSSDYPPLYIYVLYLTGRIVELPLAAPYLLPLIKLPSILADAATAYLLYTAARRYFTVETGLLIAAFYMFNPAVLINSTFWGQVDSFFTLIVAAAIWLLVNRKFGWATVLLTLSVLMKPQGMIYVPVLFFALLFTGSLKSWLRAAAGGILTLLIVVLPFSSGQGPLWLYQLYTGTVNEYPYASVNAYNLFALIGANYTESSSTLALFSYHTWGMIFIVLVTLYTGWMYLRSRDARFVILGALMQIAGVFTFSSSIHERYLFPAAALSLLAYACWRDRRLLWLGFGFSATVFLNTYAVYYGYLSRGSTYGFTMFTASLLNLAMCLLLGKLMWELSRRPQAASTVAPPAADDIMLPDSVPVSLTGQSPTLLQ